MSTLIAQFSEEAWSVQACMRLNCHVVSFLDAVFGVVLFFIFYRGADIEKTTPTAVLLMMLVLLPFLHLILACCHYKPSTRALNGETEES